MLQRQRQGTVDVIQCDEALVEEHLGELASLLDECQGKGQPRVVLDLSLVPLIDSQGLEQILDTRDEFERLGGTLKLAAPTELCRDILTCTGLIDQVEVFADVKLAVGSFVR